MSTLAPSANVVTSRDPKGLKFVSIVEAAYNKAGLSEKEAQRVNDTAGLADLISNFIAENRVTDQFKDEEVESTYGYLSGYSGEIAGKTGTTNDNIDAWFVGTKPRLSMAIWIGFDDASYGMGKSGMGAELAAPLWARIGKKIKDLQVVPEEKFNFSKKATRLVVCRESGLFASDVCPDRVSELFTKEGRPSGTCRLSHDYVPRLR
jgi:membrane carboxypeptidase/penicillin-binding protein